MMGYIVILSVVMENKFLLWAITPPILSQGSMIISNWCSFLFFLCISIHCGMFVVLISVIPDCTRLSCILGRALKTLLMKNLGMACKSLSPIFTVWTLNGWILCLVSWESSIYVLTILFHWECKHLMIFCFISHSISLNL